MNNNEISMLKEISLTDVNSFLFGPGMSYRVSSIIFVH